MNSESKMSKSECERATDYTLPPFGGWIASPEEIEDYGRQCADAARAPLLAANAALNARIAELERSRDFYKRRCDLLQQWQARMRDPERTLVCDVLANGQVLPDPNGTRYPPAQQAAQCGEPFGYVSAHNVDPRGGEFVWKPRPAFNVPIYAAPPSQPVALPPGWVAVPREPTSAMVAEAHAVDTGHGSWPRNAYAAMLAAAPAGEDVPR